MTPDAQREQWIEDLRAEYGEEWVEDHAVMLESQLLYLVEQHFLD